MREAVNLAPALTVHNEQLKDTLMCNGPRDLRQVRSLKYREKKKQKPQVAEGEPALTNFEDHVQNTRNMLHSHLFVQAVLQFKGKTLAVIMYTNDQMTDFRRSCCGNDLTKSSVLGCDKTFNLGPLHLTVTVFKQHSVTRMATNDNPKFFGPMCLHGNSDRSTWTAFFQHLATALDGCEKFPVFGSDDE